MQPTPWGPAVTRQLDALKLIDLVARNQKILLQATQKNPGYRWEVEAEMLRRATPFAWGAVPTMAVAAASKSIPEDALFNAWNLPAEMQWWHFEQPIAIAPGMPSIRAILFGWLTEARDTTTGDVRFRVGDGYDRALAQAEANVRIARYLACACYSDDETGQYPIMAGATWRWEVDDSVQAVCERGFKEHQRNYGPGGKLIKEDPTLERTFEETRQFIEQTRALSKFVLAGLAWLNQKVAVTSHEPVTPKRSIVYQTFTGRKLQTVRVVSLRKAEPREPTGDGEAKWHVSVQFVVSGHWRNQVCGLRRSDRRLTYIQPFVKGPDNAPFKEAVPKVFKVDR